MPHIQLDVPKRYPLATKEALAQRIGRLYADIMQTSSDIVDVTFRELNEGGVWHCTADSPVPAAVISCAIRRGRPPEQRARLADALVDACAEALDLDPVLLAVEFTQHSGDEIFRKLLIDGVLKGGLGKDWSPSETERSVLDTLRAENRVGAGGP